MGPSFICISRASTTPDTAYFTIFSTQMRCGSPVILRCVRQEPRSVCEDFVHLPSDSDTRVCQNHSTEVVRLPWGFCGAPSSPSPACETVPGPLVLSLSAERCARRSPYEVDRKIKRRGDVTGIFVHGGECSVPMCSPMRSVTIGSQLN